MIGIICFWDRYATPYLAKYERVLNDNNIPFEVVFWNRTPQTNISTFSQNKNYVFINLKCKDSRIGKVNSFFSWASQVKKIIKQRHYSHLILLSTVPAILLYSSLRFNFRNKYIFDIRDYTYEDNTLFKKVVMSIIKQSSFTTISSKGFWDWLDYSDKIIVNHNITVNNKESSWLPPVFSDNKKVNFAFVGNVRLDMQTEALLHKLKNDPRIDQYFYGRILPSCNIQAIKEEAKISNLYLMGPFDSDDKQRIFDQVDLINCVYANSKDDNNIPLGDSTPLPNRLYDALVFMRPIVASKGTYLAKLVDEYNLGVCINGFSPDARDKIIDYINHFDSELFKDGCNRLRCSVEEEEIVFLKKLVNTLLSWK